MSTQSESVHASDGFEGNIATSADTPSSRCTLISLGLLAALDEIWWARMREAIVAPGGELDEIVLELHNEAL